MGKQVTKFNSSKVVVIFLVLVLVLGSVFWFNSNNKSEDSTNTPTPEWAEYKDEKYGLKFEYIKSWGDPRITELARKTGKHYDLAFGDATKQNTVVVVASFGSADEANPGDPACEGRCDIKPYTKDSVKASLAGDKKSFLKYGDTSYSMYFTDAASMIAGSVSMYQIVDLKKVNSSAVQIAYTLTGNGPCPTDKLADNSNNNCITEETYEQIDKFAKSIQNI